MHSSFPSDHWTSDDYWAWQQAGLAIGAAVDCAVTASAVLAPLPEQTDWQSDGLRALLGVLGAYRSRTSLTLSELSSCESAWRAVPSA
ncbi:hypothetical protein [Microbacterium sp. 179-I 3D4 NHS]|uniref:hypothetical protein n=1 Tax=Microbacterium sp. 179-I 3D4 NHS TaxID=3142381 RepID=UPI0039A2FD01